MSRYLIVFGLLISLHSTAQTDTIRLQQTKLAVYLCSIDSLNNWYLFTDDHQSFTLARLSTPSTESATWYRRFKDSQNLYRASVLELDGRKMLTFMRSEADETPIYFELRKQTPDTLTMWVSGLKQTFFFQRIEVQ